ncbi:MAG: hypothetical protein Q9205_003076 [Flavoplaca limonia]
MAPRSDKPPVSTTNVILGVTLSFGIVALIIGLYFIYTAYMSSLDYRPNKNIRSNRRTPERTSTHTGANKAQLRDEYTDPWPQKPKDQTLQDRKWDISNKRNTRRDHRNGDAAHLPKEIRDYSRGRRFKPRHPTGSFNGRRMSGGPLASQAPKAYEGRQKYDPRRRTQSVGRPEFAGAGYHPAGLPSDRQYPYREYRPTRERKFDASRNSYPTQLPNAGFARGQDAYGQGWARDEMPQEWRPRSAHRTTKDTMPSMSMPLPQDATDLNPKVSTQRLGTPINPVSEASQLISDLIDESVHDDHDRRSERTYDDGRFLQAFEDRHDGKSSTSGRGEFDQGSGRGSHLGSGSSGNSLGERSLHQVSPQQSVKADAKYDRDIERGNRSDQDIPGSHGEMQDTEMKDEHQVPDSARIERW